MLPTSKHQYWRYLKRYKNLGNRDKQEKIPLASYVHQLCEFISVYPFLATQHLRHESVDSNVTEKVLNRKKEIEKYVMHRFHNIIVSINYKFLQTVCKFSVI